MNKMILFLAIVSFSTFSVFAEKSATIDISKLTVRSHTNNQTTWPNWTFIVGRNFTSISSELPGLYMDAGKNKEVVSVFLYALANKKNITVWYDETKPSSYYGYYPLIGIQVEEN